MDLLPEDVLADVLHHLPPRGLAVSRCVCREWCATVDARCDLRTDLLPTKLGGVFVQTNVPENPEFFVRPSMERRIAGRLEYYERMKYCRTPYILDCCNGLLLLQDYNKLVNPATRQQARLPPHPATSGSGYYFKYLAFDPASSPHYEVLAMQNPFDLKYKLSSEGSEWPPSVYMMGVYSSSTAIWEERPFGREEGSATTITPVGSGFSRAAYLNRALYTYWKGDFITRITFFNDKYKIINLPVGTKYDSVYLGKSKNKIHFAIVDGQLRLQVWFLNELGGKTEWILKHVANLHTLHFPEHDHETDRPWISQYGKYEHESNEEPSVDDDLDWNSDEDNTLDSDDETDRPCVSQYGKYEHESNKEPSEDNDLDWNSDEDNTLDIDEMGGEFFDGTIDVFGFHPYREILFLCLSGSRIVACYCNASKMKDLGEFSIPYCYQTIHKTFIYTPCWNEELFAEN